jgi:hypothetical protein
MNNANIKNENVSENDFNLFIPNEFKISVINIMQMDNSIKKYANVDPVQLFTKK